MYTVSPARALSPIITLRNKLAGNGPIYLGAGGNAYDGDARQVAFYAVTDNAVDGIYVSPV